MCSRKAYGCIGTGAGKGGGGGGGGLNNIPSRCYILIFIQIASLYYVTCMPHGRYEQPGVQVHGDGLLEQLIPVV